MSTPPLNPNWTSSVENGLAPIACPPAVIVGLVGMLAASAAWVVLTSPNAAFSRMALAENAVFDFERDVIDIALGPVAIGLAAAAALLWSGRMMAWPFVSVLSVSGAFHGLRVGFKVSKGIHATSEYDPIRVYQFGVALLIVAFVIVSLVLLAGSQARQWSWAHRLARARQTQCPTTRF